MSKSDMTSYLMTRYSGWEVQKMDAAGKKIKGLNAPSFYFNGWQTLTISLTELVILSYLSSFNLPRKNASKTMCVL